LFKGNREIIQKDIKKNVQIGAVNCDDEANKALCSKEGVGKK